MDDLNDAPTSDALIGLPVVSSTNKLSRVLVQLGEYVPDDPLQAAMLALLGGVSPMLVGLLPTDPSELDELLLAGAKWMLSMRSDDAWAPETITDLYLGEDR